MVQNINNTDRSSSDAITRDFLDSLVFELRYLDAVQPTTECTVFGEKIATPVMAGAVAKHERFHEGGSLLYAEGVRRANTIMWVGFMEDDDLKPLLDKGTKIVRIIKPLADRDKVCRMIESSEKLGCIAVGMDIDHAFKKKDGVPGVMLSGMQFGVPTTEDMKLYSSITKLPFVAKGVLSVCDAVKCVEAGVGALVVSHHQNIFPWAVAPMAVLSEIVDAVNGKIPVFADCGLYSGYDVFKALALGASGTCIVRPLLAAFHNTGADGITEVLERITCELRGTLARTCSPDIYHIDPTVLRKRIR